MGDLHMWVHLIWQTLKNVGVLDLFMLVRLPRRRLLSVIFQTVHVAECCFHVSSHPLRLHGPALNWHAGCSMCKTHHQAPEATSTGTTSMTTEGFKRGKVTHTHAHTKHMCSHTQQTVLFLISCYFLRGDMQALVHLSRGGFEVISIGFKHSTTSSYQRL